MTTLQQLAENYERRAADGEALANRIIAGLNTLLRKELQVRQLETAERLLQEARLLRLEAARLRLLTLQPPREKDVSVQNSEGASQLVLRRLNILRQPH